MNQLKRLFQDLDVDGSGTISQEEIEKLFMQVDMRALLKALGLDIHQARSFFKLLDMDMSNEVDIEEFVQGLMRLRGWAKGVDVATIMYENKRLFMRLKQFMRDVDGNFKRLTKNMDTMQQTN